MRNGWVRVLVALAVILAAGVVVIPSVRNQRQAVAAIDPTAVRYEAELAARTGNVVVETTWCPCSNNAATGNMLLAGDGLTFTVNAPTTGTHRLVLAYSAALGAARRQLTVNGIAAPDVALPSTPGWNAWRTVEVAVALNAGANTVRLLGVGDTWTNLDYLDVIPVVSGPTTTTTAAPTSVQRFEAEAATRAGAVTIGTGSCPCSGGQAITNMRRTSDSLTFSVTSLSATSSQLVWAYSAATGSGTRRLVVNGAAAGSATFPGTATWSGWQQLTTPAVNLRAGANTIQIVGAGGVRIDLDYLEVTLPRSATSTTVAPSTTTTASTTTTTRATTTTTTPSTTTTTTTPPTTTTTAPTTTTTSGPPSQTRRFEAESGVRAGATAVETQWCPCSGGRHVGGMRLTTDSLTLTVPASAAGSNRLTFGYAAAGSGAVRRIVVNGVTFADTRFAVTPTWSSWTELSLRYVPLQAGNNTVQIVGAGDWWVNLDYLDVTAETTVGPNPTGRGSELIGGAKLMPLGDSITVGMHGTEAFWWANKSLRGGYRGRLLELLQNSGARVDFVGGTGNDAVDPRETIGDIDHEGHGGYCVSGGNLSCPADWSVANGDGGLDTYVPTWFGQHKPDIVLLHAGTNDFAGGDSIATVIANYGLFLDVITAAAPNAYVFVSGLALGDRADIGDSFNPQLQALVAAKSASTRGRLFYVDTYAGMANPIWGEDANKLHPSLSNYEVMGTNWYSALRRELPGMFPT